MIGRAITSFISTNNGLCEKLLTYNAMRRKLEAKKDEQKQKTDNLND